MHPNPSISIISARDADRAGLTKVRAVEFIVTSGALRQPIIDSANFPVEVDGLIRTLNLERASAASKIPPAGSDMNR
jgi:hypothetical protein